MKAWSSLARQPLAGKEGLDRLCYSTCGSRIQRGQIIKCYRVNTDGNVQAVHN